MYSGNSRKRKVRGFHSVGFVSEIGCKLQLRNLLRATLPNLNLQLYSFSLCLVSEQKFVIICISSYSILHDAGKHGGRNVLYAIFFGQGAIFSFAVNEVGLSSMGISVGCVENATRVGVGQNQWGWFVLSV